MRGASAAALIDRAGSGVAALALASLVATSATAAGFGQFALLFAFSIGAQAAYRAVPGSWLVIDAARTGEASPDTAAVRLALWLGTVACGFVFLAGGLTDTSWWMAGAVGAHCLAALLSDCVRLCAYGARQAHTPAALSVATFSIFLALAGGWSAFGRPGEAPVAVGALALSLAIPPAAMFVRRRPGGRTDVREYLADHRADAAGQVSSAAASSAAQVLVPTLLHAVAGPALVGSIRGAQSVASVPAQVPVGLQPVLLSTAARRHREDGSPNQMGRWVVSTTVIFAIAMVGVALVPDGMGLSLFGDSWQGIAQAMPGVLGSTWATSVLLAYEVEYRVSERMHRFSLFRACGLALVCVGATLGAVVAGATGASWGLAIANSALLAAVAIDHHRLVRRRPIESVK